MDELHSGKPAGHVEQAPEKTSTSGSSATAKSNGKAPAVEPAVSKDKAAVNHRVGEKISMKETFYASAFQCRHLSVSHVSLLHAEYSAVLLLLQRIRTDHAYCRLQNLVPTQTTVLDHFSEPALSSSVVMPQLQQDCDAWPDMHKGWDVLQVLEICMML